MARSNKVYNRHVVSADIDKRDDVEIILSNGLSSLALVQQALSSATDESLLFCRIIQDVMQDLEQVVLLR